MRGVRGGVVVGVKKTDYWWSGMCPLAYCLQPILISPTTLHIQLTMTKLAFVIVFQTSNVFVEG